MENDQYFILTVKEQPILPDEASQYTDWLVHYNNGIGSLQAIKPFSKQQEYCWLKDRKNNFFILGYMTEQEKEAFHSNEQTLQRTLDPKEGLYPVTLINKQTSVNVQIVNYKPMSKEQYGLEQII